LRNADNNTIFGNFIDNSKEYGIALEYSSDANTIYFNDIFENQEGQAFEDQNSEDNQWDNGTTGNFWGDYNDNY